MPNEQKCVDLLDCYLENDCGPSDSCATDANAGPCHVNEFDADGAALEVATDAYDAICG